jgi:hypothetical protein
VAKAGTAARVLRVAGGHLHNDKCCFSFDVKMNWQK